VVPKIVINLKLTTLEYKINAFYFAVFKNFKERLKENVKFN